MPSETFNTLNDVKGIFRLIQGFLAFHDCIDELYRLSVHAIDPYRPLLRANKKQICIRAVPSRRRFFTLQFSGDTVVVV